MKPISSHPKSLAQFVQPNPKIIAAQTTIPKVETTFTAGTLKPLGISGCFTRMIQIPRQTIAKARSVPMLTRSPRKTILKNAARNATKHPTAIDVR